MIDPKKQYRTRDGREVRIYAVDGKGPSSVVHGAVNAGDGWVLLSWFADGRYNTQTGMADLIEVLPRIKRKYWVNVYHLEQAMTWAFVNRKLADSAAASCKDERIACVEIDIDVEEGHGL